VPTPGIKAFGLNALIIISHAYFFQGLAIVASYFQARAWGRIFRWVIYLLILSQIYIMMIVTGLGLFDTWFDFRNRIRNTKGDDL